MATQDTKPAKGRHEDGRPVGETGRAWHTLARMARPRATRANGFAAVLAILLGFAIVTQVQQTQQQGLEQLREPELIRILDDVTQDSNRLDDEARSLEFSRQRLLSSSASDEALTAARERLDTLGILAGTAPATGPGIMLRIGDPDQQVTAALLLDAIQELRDAGAEAIQVGSVRVVASTYFTDVEDGISVDGATVSTPYEIRAIGDAATLASAMDIPGGVSESVRREGADASVVQVEELTVAALHTVQEPRYARPVPEPSTAPS